MTGGWLFAPAAFSDDGRMADITREGYLFQWDLPKLPACQTEWPSFRHDPQQSGNYDRDGTPPNAAAELAVQGNTLSFQAPGDDYGCGRATKLQVATADQPIDSANFDEATRIAAGPARSGAAAKESLQLPAHKRYVAVRAIDDAGNVGPAADVDTGTGGTGGRGACGNVISGGPHADRLKGTRRSDRILGRGGRDRIRGLRGRDCLSGGAGPDRLDGGKGADKLKGGKGADKLKGGKGADKVKGGKGADKVLAGPRDVVKSGPGNDRIRVKGRRKATVACGRGRDVAIVRRHSRARLHGCERVRQR